MTLETQKYVSKVRNIEAVQVTAENIKEVARWSRGKLQGPENEPYILLHVPYARDVRQTMAYPGDYVTYDKRTFKIFPEKNFRKIYELATPVDVALNSVAERVHRVIHRSAVDGEFVTEEEAQASPDTTVEETVDP